MPLCDTDVLPPLEIIISLQDKAYERIKKGIKTYEFRRRWKLDSTVAYIYRSGKKRELCAFIELGKPIFGSPSEIAEIAEKMIPGNGASVEEYFTPTQGGYAVPINRFVEFPAISLQELREFGIHPPQYYTYLSNYPALRELIQEKLNHAC
ncbi:hypothetical protein D9M68_605520 [compost metagenome]